MTSRQTLSDADRRTLARWAADCAERVLPLFAAPVPADEQIHDALARARAYGDGKSSAAEEIGRRMIAVKAAGAATTPAGAAAARSVAQAASVAHMGAHALGAAAYAAKAVSLSEPAHPDAVRNEVRWQVAHLTDEQRDALRRLPALGSDTSGPLGPGLLSKDIPGEVIREIQNLICLDRPTMHAEKNAGKDRTTWAP